MLQWNLQAFLPGTGVACFPSTHAKGAVVVEVEAKAQDRFDRPWAWRVWSCHSVTLLDSASYNGVQHGNNTGCKSHTVSTVPTAYRRQWEADAKLAHPVQSRPFNHWEHPSSSRPQDFPKLTNFAQASAGAIQGSYQQCHAAQMHHFR